MGEKELMRGQIREIIDEAMRLASRITLRDEVTLEDLYKMAEALKGLPLTTKEKKIIAGIVTRNYPRKIEEENRQIKIFIV